MKENRKFIELLKRIPEMPFPKELTFKAWQIGLVPFKQASEYHHSFKENLEESRVDRA